MLPRDIIPRVLASACAPSIKESQRKPDDNLQFAVLRRTERALCGWAQQHKQEQIDYFFREHLFHLG